MRLLSKRNWLINVRLSEKLGHDGIENQTRLCSEMQNRTTNEQKNFQFKLITVLLLTD